MQGAWQAGYHARMNSLPTCHRGRAGVPLLALALLLPPLYLWWVLFSPWGYVPPEGLPAHPEAGLQAVFVYGTLRNGLVRRIVVGRAVESAPASLPGYRKVGLDLQPAADESVPGERLVVTTSELLRLDRYERLGIRYERVQRVLADGSEAWVYRRLEP